MPRPPSDSRRRLLAATRELLQRQGYQATAMSEIVAASGAPRGSLYYLFPGGKEELAVAAITESAAEFTDLIRETAAHSDGVRAFCELLADRLREGLVRTDYLGGSPVSAVTLDSTPRSPALTIACRDTYRQWRTALEAALVQYGAPPDRAARLATLMLSAVEGALMIARAEGSTQPLDDIRADLVDLAVAATEMSARTSRNADERT
ncbi:TetR/AcrR family transcriptional regulator [Nocardia transvalensis]|uniref:TetR/AcrR family transcriptional regulator n=1 Tax=Nocardia transvalensis TaxID=37333 RepID=UPI001895D593|nr:TetR/AcrR family transcriptional regulator [Nocardia transvalensis]MBF6332151.1 TetR/AcrR family transcriptional regulator [Nocardia transvalensis]